MLNGIDGIKTTLESLASAVEEDQIKGFIASLKNAAQEMVTKADQRKEEITREEEIPGDDLIPSE
jgi:hypothetical protein